MDLLLCRASRAERVFCLMCKQVNEFGAQRIFYIKCHYETNHKSFEKFMGFSVQPSIICCSLNWRLVIRTLRTTALKRWPYCKQLQNASWRGSEDEWWGVIYRRETCSILWPPLRLVKYTMSWSITHELLWFFLSFIHMKFFEVPFIVMELCQSSQCAEHFLWHYKLHRPV